MAAFTLDALKAKKELKLMRVPVSEFGDGVDCCYIAEMSADEQDNRLGVPWSDRREKLKQKDNAGFHAFAVAAHICDENRNWLASSAADINNLADQLQQASAKAVMRIFIACDKLNGISGGEAEVIEKN